VGVIGDTSANLLVERVGFEGGSGTSPFVLHNYDDGAFFLGLSGDQPLTGTFKVVSSRFRYGEDSLLLMDVRNAQITIGGSPFDGNVIENGAFGGGFLDLDQSVFEYSYNNVAVADYPAAGVLVAQGLFALPREPSQFLIQHNTFKATGGYEDGIWIADVGPASGVGKKGDFVITNNVIQIGGSEAGPAYAGIQSDGTVGTVISNNRISGSGLWGIAMEGDTGCTLLGNNVARVTAEGAGIGLLMGWWGTPTSNCTVVGGSNKANVYDEGISNIVVGVNNMQSNPPGDAIKEAMQGKHDLLKSRLRR